MNGIGRRAWIAMTILCTLLLPAVASSAGSNDRLREIRERREALHEQIEQHEAQAESVGEEAKALNKQIVALRADLTALDRDIERIESQVRTVQARIDATQAEIDAVEDVAMEQAVILYKAGSVDVIDTLLDSESLSELDDRIEMLGVAAQENTGKLIEYGRLQVEIEASHQELFDKKQELTQTHDEQAAILADMDEAHEKLKGKLAELEETLGNEHAEEGDLLIAERRVAGDIRAAQALEAVTARGTSSQGFIWPLNGAINSYYGPRWGRMHTGIDIDGVTGDPIVASNDGRVIQAGPYSGYGNCVIIDHGGGISTLYAHLSSFNVSSGQDVSQGEIVGNVGCTGSCTGDHLHFEVRVNGGAVDPLDYLP